MVWESEVGTMSTMLNRDPAVEAGEHRGEEKGRSQGLLIAVYCDQECKQVMARSVPELMALRKGPPGWEYLECPHCKRQYPCGVHNKGGRSKWGSNSR